MQEFDPSTPALTGPRRIVVDSGVGPAKKPIWIEGPHRFRRGEWYYLSCAEGGTGNDHSQVIFRSTSATGPFVPWTKNPILTQRDLDGTVQHAVTATGHADMVIGPDDNWWAVFLGCRPFGGRFVTTGDEKVLAFAFATDDAGEWRTLVPEADATLLSTQVAGGFVGSLLGVHARIEQ